ncbi:HDOD domain-containing protein [Azospira restricta]|uniref:HDOD domain-containing protein n=1 Tax=Azospira restricta TaxID=404405 RepID=A0A974SLB0_9RHOO|nr:HDOD domain-containing protein [Azospira restricta]QRJ62111.1 HDOD domain-containing protein [Azospira restricta]
MLTHPLQDLETWVLFFSGAELPVLRHTVRQLDELRANIDRVNGREISRVVLQDPLMTVKVLAYIQPFAGKTLRTDITTIGSAVMMIGIEPFFEKFKDLVTIEQMLKSEPPAMLGALQLIRRVQRAAHYAHEWALWRQDLNVEEVTIAALLHDLAEILLWCFAPTLAIEMRDRQAANHALRSAAVQEAVLGIRLIDLQLALCRTWHLPKLLANLMDPEHAEAPRIRNVLLAVDLARHSAHGWNDAAIPDDFAAIGKLLNLNRDALIQRLRLSDDEKAQLPPMPDMPPPETETPAA